MQSLDSNFVFDIRYATTNNLTKDVVIAKDKYKIEDIDMERFKG